MSISIYYTSIVLLACVSLLIQMVLINENARLKTETKHSFYLTCEVIILAVVTEWFSVYLNGAPEWTRWIHILLKCLDYTITPALGLLMIRQISRTGKWIKVSYVILLINAVMQLISIFTKWIYYVDAQNYYQHGQWHIIYVFLYVIVIFLSAWQFYQYSRNFNNRNKKSLYLIVFLVIGGIAVQEISGGEIRLVYISLAIASILLFIHTNEFNQQEADEKISEQKSLLEMDTLTGLKSRYAYSRALDNLNRMTLLPEDLLVFMVDINGLKAVNDNFGHGAGDELIAGIAGCISDTFSRYGDCYRTGGDEFVTIIRAEGKNVPALLCETLKEAVDSWSDTFGRKASVSCGYVRAKDFPVYSIEKLVSIADERMYEQKAHFYKAEGRDRRKRNRTT